MSGAAPLSSGRADAVVELRQYTLHPGRRDELVALFEDVFLDGQAAAGIDVIGHFRDADDPDRFVWLRRFDSMQARADALARFYDGPLWRAHRDAANATMRDSDNVLLLRPCGSAPAVIDHRDGAGTYVVIVHDVARVDATRFAEHAVAVGVPSLVAAGAEAPQVFVTETAANTFPRLPVREGESVVVTMVRFADDRIADDALSTWMRDQPLRTRADDALLPAFLRRPEVIRLAPAPRSAMR